jgi:multiple sugar transport system substrate-binding protein
MRRLANILFLASVLLCCSACQQAADSRQVLRVANWGGAGDDSEAMRIMREVYVEFERQNPDIDLQLELIPGSQEYVRKLLMSIVAGAEPDVVTLDASSSAVFINNDILLDLSELIEKDPDFDLADYHENVVDIARRDDEVYAVPLDFTPMVMYCNKRLFDEAGIPYPQAGWTFEEFLNIAKDLTRGEQYGYAFANWMPGWILWVWNNGGDSLSADGSSADGAINSPATAEAIRFIHSMIEEHGASPSLSQTAALGVDPFLNGQAAMTISGHWNLIGIANSDKIDLEDVLVVPVPSNLPKSQTVIYEAGLGITKKSKNRDAAWRFVKYMTSEEVQRKIQSTGIAVCARKDISEERGVTELEQAFLDIIPSGRPPWGAKVEAYDVVESEGERAMDAVLKSGRPVEEALNRAADAIDRHLGDL